MAAGPDERYDFFLSRRGSVAAVAREVADVLTDKGYKVLVQDYDAPIGNSFTEMMHEAIKNSRDLIVLYTGDYEQSAYTRREFTSFEAERAQSMEERHVIVLRCEDVPLRGLLADNVYQDLVGVTDPEERKRRIIAAAERQSQAAPPARRPFIGVPPRVTTFIGRADEIDRLDTILMTDKPAAVTQSVGRAAVQGLGGVGKTSVATEYAHRYRQLYAGVCWCPSETRIDLLNSLAALAVTLGVATAGETDAEKTARAALRCMSEQRASWLLVYDNVTSPEEIADLLPSGGARVIITSRFSDWSGWADEVPLDVLPNEQAIDFLRGRTGRSDADGARILAEALGRLPLALDHAAAYCKRAQMSFAEYAAKSSRLMAVVPRGAAYPRSVAATFELAITQVVAQCTAAERVMGYLAYCAPERVPMILVEAGFQNEAERLEALTILAEASLIKHDPFEDGTPALTVHRLIQAVARARSAEKSTSNSTVEHLIACLTAVYPKKRFDDATDWTLCSKLTPHALSLWRADGSIVLNAPDWPGLLKWVAGYLHGRGLLEQAEPLMREALSIREQVLGPEHPETAGCLNNLGLLLTDKHEFAEARLILQRSLDIEEKNSGPNHPNTAKALTNLAYLIQNAFLLQKEGDLAEARPLMERALAIRSEALGPDDPDTAMSLNNLAYQLHMEKDLAAAKPLYERALAIQKKIWGSHHHHTARTLHNLGCLLKDQGDFAASRLLLDRAQTIYETVLGPEHPNTNNNRYHIVRLLLASGQLDEALALGEKALSISHKVLGPTHKSTKLDAMNLAEVLYHLDRVEESAALLWRYGINPADKTTWQ
jgi:tetratricopeptide (TPR) repeat protein